MPLKKKTVRELVTILGFIGPAAKEAIPELIKRTQDSDNTVREAAVRALGEMGSMAQDAIPHFTQRLTDPEPRVCIAAAAALGQMGPAAKATIPALAKCLTDTAVYGTAILALERIDLNWTSHPRIHEATPVLVKGLGRNDRIRTTLARIVGKIRPVAKEAIPALAKCLGDRDSDVRDSAAQALGEIDAKWASHPQIQEAVSYFVECLTSPLASQVERVYLPTSERVDKKYKSE